MKKEIEELSIDEKEKKFLDERLCNIAEKAVSGLLFGMKDSIDKDLWDSCFSNLEKVVR
jgi:glutamyl-tRNA reductase